MVFWKSRANLDLKEHKQISEATMFISHMTNTTIHRGYGSKATMLMGFL